MTDLVERLRDGWPHRGSDARLLCEEAAAEIERLRADAARYRWLRDNDIGDYAVCVWFEDVWFGENGSYIREDAKRADAAIDAAMKDAS